MNNLTAKEAAQLNKDSIEITKTKRRKIIFDAIQSLAESGRWDVSECDLAYNNCMMYEEDCVFFESLGYKVTRQENKYYINVDRTQTELIRIPWKISWRDDE